MDRRPNLELAIQSPHSTVVDGESIEVELTLRNSGGEPLTLPSLDDPVSRQPYFVIQGPSYPKPHRFHWSGVVPGATDEPSEFITVGAGSAVKTLLKLPASLALHEPGRHELYASYDWHGVATQSNRVHIKVHESGAPLYRVVGRTPLLSEVGIQALSVQGRTLYLATFHEKRPDLGEVMFRGFSRLVAVDSGATDFFAPTCQTASPGVAGPRFGWRTANTITVAGYRKLAQRIDLDFTPRIHAPSLMASNGDIEVLVTDGPGRRLSLLRFPHVAYDQPPPPAIEAWRVELPVAAIDLVAAINPAGLRRALIRHGDSIRLLSWDDGGPELHAPLAMTGQPVTEVGPALHLSVSGIARASVLAAAPGGRKVVSLTQVSWVPGLPPQVVSEEPIELQAPVRSGTIAYSMRSIETPRRDWLFVLESNRMLSSRSEGKAYVTKRQAIVPPQVLVMNDLSYTLEVRARPELNVLR